MKSLLLIAVATLGLTTATMAQVPNYVPTNGLVGYWPFNGNANDLSGNGNNGAINGAVSSVDRFGNGESAFGFNGLNQFIEVADSNTLDLTNKYSIALWVKLEDYSLNSNPTYPQRTMLGKPQLTNPSIATGWAFRAIEGAPYYSNNSMSYVSAFSTTSVNSGIGTTDSLDLNQWSFLVFTYDSDTAKLLKNGQLVNKMSVSFSLLNTSEPLFFGKEHNSIDSDARWFKGKLDDIGIWNRALTQQEITNLYTATNCANNTTISPQTNSLTTGSTATFTATTSDPNPAYVWQSNFGQGFQTLNNVGNYSGANTGTLNIANVQLPNHTQPIRVISTSGNCIDTSNVAVINILDTCITNVTVYDTLLTTVTDTLVINATLTGINPPNNLNTLKVFPNPANTHITIDYGNVSLMSGYTLKIVNALGQTVFTAPINQQTSYINLSTWTGNGIYYVQLINPQNNTIENRKIVIQ